MKTKKVEFEVSCKTCGWFYPSNFERLEDAKATAESHTIFKSGHELLIIQRKREVEA